ncbi:MAG: hypothetical protein KDC46_12295 [Thermoleophilia bacterium]|nr:hypothetical protein [Thermoleophilia bacterium]
MNQIDPDGATCRPSSVTIRPWGDYGTRIRGWAIYDSKYTPEIFCNTSFEWIPNVKVRPKWRLQLYEFHRGRRDRRLFQTKAIKLDNPNSNELERKLDKRRKWQLRCGRTYFSQLIIYNATGQNALIPPRPESLKQQSDHFKPSGRQCID